MRHIVDEVVLYLGQLLLTEDDNDGEDKGYEQHHREDERRNHKSDRTEDIVVHSRKMHLQDTHLGRWVLGEQFAGYHRR